MTPTERDIQNLREYSRGKRRRLLTNICPGCKRPHTKPQLHGRYAGKHDLVVIDYMLCGSCAKQILKGGTRAERFGHQIERNLEELGAFDIPNGVPA